MGLTVDQSTKAGLWLILFSVDTLYGFEHSNLAGNCLSGRKLNLNAGTFLKSSPSTHLWNFPDY